MAIFKSLNKALLTPLDVTTLKINIKTEELPKEIVQFENLKALYIQSDSLNTIPDYIKELVSLQIFYASSPVLETVPESLITMPNLETLSLTGCRIKTFELTPQSTIGLTSLQLNKNELDQLPKNLEHLESLETLNLADNNLGDFKVSLVNLINLKKLNLDRNSLSELPIETIKKMNSLNSISLDGNIFSDTEKEQIQTQLGYWFGEI